MSVPALDRFQKLALFTLGLTVFLVGVGAYVRVSGSGMGCPDWPKCFGLLVPPTSAEQLPPGYDRALFDVTKTWTEYLNRLLGASVGLAIFATLVAAVVMHRANRMVLGASFVAFIAVGYAAWLGARVVAHNLAPWIVTAHLMSAVVVVTALLFAVVFAFPASSLPRQPRMGFAVGSALSLTLAQAALGTQVRGTLEDVARADPRLPRGEWIEHVGFLDIAHRQLALMVLAVLIALLFSAWSRLRAYTVPLRALSVALGASVLQIAAGVGLAYLALPKALQIVHLELALIAVGALMVALVSYARGPRA